MASKINYKASSDAASRGLSLEANYNLDATSDSMAEKLASHIADKTGERMSGYLSLDL